MSEPTPTLPDFAAHALAVAAEIPALRIEPWGKPWHEHIAEKIIEPALRQAYEEGRRQGTLDSTGHSLCPVEPTGEIAGATPEEIAAAITANWKAIQVGATPLSGKCNFTSVIIGGGMVPAVREQIAAAIRDAAREARQEESKEC